jgi:DNA-binding MarR family transcriptional regulator
MHALFFALKRAHQASLRPARQVASVSGITPARFDMLYAISQGYRGMLQSELRHTLGVSAATVSRMLGSLERLGLVTRRIYSHDTRQRMVNLTSAAVAIVREVFNEAIDSDLVKLAIDSALANGRLVPSPTGMLEEMDRAESFCRCFRSAFRDSATLYYPYQPDD